MLVITTSLKPVSSPIASSQSAEFLIDVGRDHLEDIRIDGKYGSIKRLAERRGIPHNTAKDWIRKAKERSLYPPDAHKREE